LQNLSSDDRIGKPAFHLRSLPMTKIAHKPSNQTAESPSDAAAVPCRAGANTQHSMWELGHMSICHQI